MRFTHSLISAAILSCALMLVGASVQANLQAEADQENREEVAAIVNNCLDDNSALQCLAQYPEYADDKQLQEELVDQAARCKANRQAYPAEYCEM